ncbi:MAG: sulfite exporter TauE/SafE family protein [Clostridia bacterium]|nr:sulfite exporter TauE/SafE family protein [Clostridia bacterium]
MEPLHAVFLILIGFGAGFVQRVSGFGLGIFAMVFLPHLMPSHTAAATISSLFACATATYNAVRYCKKVEYKTVLPMICAALITIPIAVRFSAVVSGEIFKILLGSVLIVLSIYFLFFNQRIKIKPGIVNGLIAGGLGGTLGGLFSTGGPPVVLYLSSAAKNNLSYFATVQFYFCFTNIYATSMRAVNGLVTTELLIYAVIGMVGCMSGDFVGRKIFSKLDGKKLKQIIYIGMIISGIVMFL